MKGKSIKKTLSKKVIGTVAAVVVSAGAVLFLSNGKGKQIAVPAYTVARVIDGDTFETTEKQLIRLSSADAPEIDRCWGKEAKEALENLIVKKPLYIKVQFRDPFYRLISLVYTDEGSVNEMMIKNGNAYYGKSGHDTGEELVSAAAEARDHKRGIFSEKCTQTINTKNPKCQIKGNVRQDNIYYIPDCGFYPQVDVQLYQGDQWFCTVKEAEKAGFRKPSQCP